MESFYQHNREILKESDSGLDALLSGMRDDASITVTTARDGNVVPEVTRDGRKVYVHSRFDPVKEAERFIAEVGAERYDLFIVMGFGFAYHVEELQGRIGREATLLVLEKDAGMIKAAMASRDLAPLFSDRRVRILVNPSEDGIAEALKGKSSHRVSFITHRGSFQLDPEYYGSARNIARSYLSTKEVNIATLAKFEKAWSSNIARNAREIVGRPGANIFYDQFKGLPAIVIAAGPSLSRGIEFIRAAAGRAVLVAVDTAYLILRKHGIEPHFCLCVDPQIVNARYFEGDTGGRTILVADPTVHPSVFRLFKGRAVLTGMAFNTMKWIEEVTGERGELTHGGSVSTNAYDFARRLGLSPIVLVGQDLAFTGGLAHARGSYLDEQVHLRLGRFYTALMFNRFQLTALPKIFVRGIRSPRVHTNQKMMIFMSWFERRKDPSLVNATWDGALLSGIRHAPMEEISFHGAERDLFASIHGIYAGSAVPSRNDSLRRNLMEKSSRMLRELDALLPQVERAAALSEEMLSLMRAKKRDQARVNFILQKLSEADRVIESKHGLKDMIGITVQRVIHTITEGYEIEEEDASLGDEERVAKRSLFLYRGLLEGSLFNRKILGKLVRLLEDQADG